MNESMDAAYRAKRTALIILCVVLAVIFAGMLAVTVYFEVLIGRMNRVDGTDSTMSSDEINDYIDNETDPDADGPIVDPGDVDWGADDDPVLNDENVINILLIGQDRRPGESRARSDAMILCTINKRDKTLTMTSLMRDMYVQIPGYVDHKLNSSYAWGGMPLLNETLFKNLGIHIDGNVEVDFEGFVDVIDLLGGIELTLTDAEAAYINGKFGSNLTAGVNLVDGKQALTFARIRKVGNADFDRTGRQRAVMAAVFEKCKNLSPTKLNQLLNGVLPLVTTDLSNSQIIGYAVECFKILPQLKVSSLRIPENGTYYDATIKGMSVLIVDFDANKQLLRELGVR